MMCNRRVHEEQAGWVVTEAMYTCLCVWAVMVMRCTPESADFAVIACCDYVGRVCPHTHMATGEVTMVGAKHSHGHVTTTCKLLTGKLVMAKHTGLACKAGVEVTVLAALAC